jgi:hypothetical protein
MNETLIMESKRNPHLFLDENIYGPQNVDREAIIKRLFPEFYKDFTRKREADKKWIRGDKHAYDEFYNDPYYK